MGVYVGKEKVAPIRHTKVNNPPIPWPEVGDKGKSIIVGDTGYILGESSGGGVTIVELSDELSYIISNTIISMVSNIIQPPDDTGTGIDLYEPISTRIELTDNISDEDYNTIKSVCTNTYSGNITLVNLDDLGIVTPCNLSLNDTRYLFSVVAYTPVVVDYVYNIRATVSFSIIESILANDASTPNTGETYCDISVECAGVSENVQPIPPNIA